MNNKGKNLKFQIILSKKLCDESKRSLELLALGFLELGHQVTFTRSIWQNDYNSDNLEGFKNWFMPKKKNQSKKNCALSNRRYYKPSYELLKSFDLTVVASLDLATEPAFISFKNNVICWVLVPEIQRFSPKIITNPHVPLVYDCLWSRNKLGTKVDFNLKNKWLIPPIEEVFSNPIGRLFQKNSLKLLIAYEKKNHHGFFNGIHALGSLLLKGICFELTIVAPTPMADFGLGEKVVVEPSQENLASIMKTHHILLLPGDYSSGMLIRGMASGMACFTSLRGIAADIHQQQNCLVIPEDSTPESWSVSISHWLEQPEELKNIGESALKQGKHWTPIATASQLLEAVHSSTATTNNNGEHQVHAIDIEKMNVKPTISQ